MDDILCYLILCISSFNVPKAGIQEANDEYVFIIPLKQFIHLKRWQLTMSSLYILNTDPMIKRTKRKGDRMKKRTNEIVNCMSCVVLIRDVL